ncbi:MAG TPA: LemA family protein [Chitinophagaceae bacterium]|nr:LemA family protein [Chitinophagaceae bacterium]MCB9056844.1 LemA family protein [Chitinophagales bacterium]HPG12649.1 LemA family protein [Chitinophagaceae bacterium]
MKGTRNLTLLIVLGLVLILGVWGCSGYNGVVKQDENVKNTWANVQSTYQRRADLIPNLVNTVKGEADFEQKTLIQTIEARYKNLNSVKIDPANLTTENIAKFQQAQGELSSALSRLMVVVENYPNLKTNEGFRNLQAQLEGTENRINVARNDFNGAVNTYNTKVRSFPMNLLAGMFGFKVKEGFKAEEGADKAPEVKF